MIRGVEMKKAVLIVCILFVGVMTGCVRVKEGVKCVLGFSTQVLEDNRSNSVIKEFPLDFKTCYARTQGALEEIGAYVYRKNSGMIALYVSEADTTPVGIFFTSVNSAQTKLEFSSPSTFAKEYIARRVGLRLEGKKEELSSGEGANEEQKAVVNAPSQTKRLQDELQN